MIIKKVAIGNDTEAFIEDRFSNSLNIIFSNDNNRGKTLLMQSIVHSIGYESIFPSGFNSKEYYFYSNFEINGAEFEFLRRRNSILVLTNDQLTICNSISEFKYFFDSEIYKLPKIDKNGEIRTADLSLFYELFFLGQDKRDTSNIIVKGQNNKVDFINMVYSMAGVKLLVNDNYDIDNLKNEKATLESKIKAETKRIKIFKKNPEIAPFVSAASNNIDFKNTSNQLLEINKNISELRKKRNREENRRIKLSQLIYELSSLNRSLNEGKVKCADCGSSKIIFTNEDFEFEVSNDFVRQNILESIKNNIEMKQDIIDEYNKEINREQEQLTQLLENTSPDAKNFVLFQEEILESKSIDKEVHELQKNLDDVLHKIKSHELKVQDDKNLQKTILTNILNEMSRLYNKIDPQGLLTFDDIFTKNGVTYSGSEGQEYYFCKIMALNKALSHNFPIIIDSFREGELSSSKELLMLEEFQALKKQIVITSTLKDEEYSADKYKKVEGANVLDYSKFEDSKLLQAQNVASFKSLIEKFKIS